MAKSRVIEVQFPVAGVDRRLGFPDLANMRPPYATPWAVNVRPEDALLLRLRGGSRPGMTKFSATQLTGLTNLITVPTASSTGAATLLAGLVSNVLKVINADTAVVTTPSGYLMSEAGEFITTEANERISISTGTLSGTHFLATRAMRVYSITTAGVTVLDVKTGVVEPLVATAGSVPTGCTVGCVYRDRLVLAGGDNAIYMSRQGDPTDWNYGAEVNDSGRAMAFQLSEAGEVGEKVTAVIPSADAFLMACTLNSLWGLRGDPAADGSLHCITRDTGIVSGQAWTRIPGGIVFLGRQDLYRVGVDGGSLENLSGGRIPQELLNLDTETGQIVLGWQSTESGVYLFFTPPSAGRHHWFFDLAQKGFWGLSLQADHQPVAVVQTDNRLVLGCHDGYLRTFGGTDDDGEDIESHLLLGPIRPGSANNFGMLLNLHGVIGTGSGTVTWRLVAGNTAEEACQNAKTAIGLYEAGNTAGAEAYAFATGDWVAGRSHTAYPRCRAMWVVLWLQASAPWAYEGVSMELSQFGRWR